MMALIVLTALAIAGWEFLSMIANVLAGNGGDAFLSFMWMWIWLFLTVVLGMFSE